MRSNKKYSAILLVVAAAGVAAFVLVPSRMQDMEKRNAARNSSSELATTKLPSMKDPGVVIKKKERVLEVYDGDKVVITYPVVLGFAPTGDKLAEGDGRTPEGEFFIFTKNPESRFHLSLGLSYPSTDDARRGLADGLISKAEHDAIVAAIKNKEMPPQKTALGGEIFIHGGGVASDWTWGCMAMKNEDIEELFSVLPVGTKVTIRP